MLIGYSRVSTQDQNTHLQRDALLAAGIDEEYLYEDHGVSGTRESRPALDECIRSLREGDTLVVYSLSRLGRKVSHLAKMVEDLRDRGVSFRSLTEPFDTTSPMGFMFFNIMASIAQVERDLISERTKAGVEAARKRGRVGGRRNTLKPERAKRMVEEWEAGGISAPELAEGYGISVSTMHRYVAKHRAAAKVTDKE